MYLALPGMYSDWRSRVMIKNTPKTAFIVQSEKRNSEQEAHMCHWSKWRSVLKITVAYSTEILSRAVMNAHYVTRHNTIFNRRFCTCYGWHNHDPGRHRYELTLVEVLGFWAWKINKSLFSSRNNSSYLHHLNAVKWKKNNNKNLYWCFLKMNKAWH